MPGLEMGEGVFCVDNDAQFIHLFREELNVNFHAVLVFKDAVALVFLGTEITVFVLIMDVRKIIFIFGFHRSQGINFDSIA